MEKGGYKFIQALIPVKTHKHLIEKSRKLNQSNAETIRNAIAAYLGIEIRSSNDSCETKKW